MISAPASGYQRRFELSMVTSEKLPTTMSDQPRNLLIRALESDDVAAIDALVRAHPGLLNAPKVRPAITAARSVATAERLLRLGADVEAVGTWWARGMYTRQVAQEVGRLLVER